MSGPLKGALNTSWLVPFNAEGKVIFMVLTNEPTQTPRACL